jgi:glutaminyl-peptide cyclotransferase
MSFSRWSLVLVAIAMAATCIAADLCFAQNPSFRPADAAPVYGYHVINTYPHGNQAFTEGLVYSDGFLYEGTGQFGRSTIMKENLGTGETLKSHSLPEKYFGEGITIWNDKLYQLTWRSKCGFVYDKDSFQVLRVFRYQTEGWGLTHDEKYLIMSDGSATLRFLDPNSFQVLRELNVTDRGNPVRRLNELEYVKGQIYANVWGTERIACISPETGKVLSWVNLEGLLSDKDLTYVPDVLNGIAYDVEHDRLFVTGKYWPKLFEIKVVPKT